VEHNGRSVYHMYHGIAMGVHHGSSICYWGYVMANQVRLGKRGERIAQCLFGGRRTKQCSVYDVIDRSRSMAYEVKCQQYSKHVRVHIEDDAYDRKLAYACKHKLTPMLVLVVIHGPLEIQIYLSPLKKHARPSDMWRVQ